MSIIERIPIKAVTVTTSSAKRLPDTLSRNGGSVEFTDQSGRLHVVVESAPWISDCERSVREAAATGLLRLVVGDYTEPGVSEKAGHCANATLIEIDLRAGRVCAITSLVGLPPVTMHRTDEFDSLSCPFIPTTRHESAVDIDGVADTLRWGHPLDGRTLYKGLQVVPPKSVVTLEVGRQPTISQQERRVSHQPYVTLSRQQLIEAEIGALLAAASRLPCSDAFMSLSGGLDSRTALVALLSQGRRVPCVSMAGSPYSLDARIARRFCEVNDLRHQLVEFGNQYERQLPELALQSASVTGGVACLSQTVDLYMYSQLERAPHIRISGLLGNQVGRGGVEGFGAASLSEEIFSAELRLALMRRAIQPWFISRMAETGYASVLFEQEVHYWSIANYMSGSSRALQVGPYADVAMIELAKERISRDQRFRNPTKNWMRRRDFRHRLIGPPRRQSFQRTMLTRYAKSRPDIPINWGWRARGGWSIYWSPAAARTAADAIAGKLGRQFKPLNGLMTRASRALGKPFGFVAWPEVIRGPLRALTYDVLLSREIKETGLFEVDNLRRVLDEHFNGRENHHTTLYRTLEIALGMVSRPTPRT